jgi:TRAP-type C4-dicarboxylate transport system substrate-binding protein
VPWPELPGALQQGVVDGQENGVTNIVNASLYQNQKYVYARRPRVQLARLPDVGRPSTRG